MMHTQPVTLKANFWNKNCTLVLWAKWCGHISSFQFRNRLKITKTNMCSEHSDLCPISNSDNLIFFTPCEKLLTTVILGESEITDSKNLFELVWTCLSSVVRNYWSISSLKADVVKQNWNFVLYSAQVTVVGKNFHYRNYCYCFLVWHWWCSLRV